MKVLFFNYEYPPLGGGAGNATFCILREFAKMPDLKLDIVTSSVDSEYHLEKISEDIRIHKLPIGKDQKNLHFQTKRDLIVYTLKAYFFARKLARKNKYDLSHSFFTVPCGFLSLLLKWHYKIPYIVSLRGADVPGYSERFSLIYKFLTPLIRLIWKNSKVVVANSQGLKKLALKSNPNQKFSVIYNGVDTEYFRPAIKNESEIKLSGEKKIVITPGASRLTARKGIKYLIEAVYKLLPKYPHIQLKIIGEGSDKKNMEHMVKELKMENNVQFLGRITHEKIAPYYREADIFVLPSLNEGMSNAMLEAISSGLPIIATRTGGAKELVKEGINGFNIKTRSSADIAEKIERMINDFHLRQKMGQESRNLALKFSWKSVAEQYLEAYQEIIFK